MKGMSDCASVPVRPCLLEAAAIFLIGAMFGVTFGPSPHAGTWTWPLAYLHAIKVISWDCRSFSLWFESISGIPICSVSTGAACFIGLICVRCAICIWRGTVCATVLARLNPGLCDGLDTARSDFAPNSYCSLVRKLSMLHN